MSALKKSNPKSIDKRQYLNINHNKRKIKAKVISINYRDKDTRQIVIYIPSLEITGYGNDHKKAEEMLMFSIDQYFRYLINLQKNKLEKELKELGWQRDKYKKKEFSKIYIDKNGDLKNFNAVADQVEVKEKILTI